MTSTATRQATYQAEPLRRWRFRLLPKLAGVLLVFWIGILAAKWPFTLKAVFTGMQHETGRPVQFRAFHPTFFPLGYVAEDVTFVNRHPENKPSITVRRLTVTASYWDLLLMRKKATQVTLTGLHILVPSVPPAFRYQEVSTREKTPPRFSVIGQIQITDSVVEFAPSVPHDDPLVISVKNATFNNVNRHSPSSFRAELVTSEPRGTIYMTGQLGPWNWDDAGQTLLQGAFTLTQADLSTIGNIQGKLNAHGQFSGPLQSVACDGAIEVPQFGVSDERHTLPLFTSFHAHVNGTNGDVVLNEAESRLSQTVIRAQGEVKTDETHAGKAAHLHLSIDKGQIEDLLLLFTQNRQSSMTGTVRLQADLDLPPGQPGFLEKLKLRGDFGMQGSRFTGGRTQSPIDHLSKSAGGMSKGQENEDTQTVLSSIQGHVMAQNGVAALSHVSFAVPGAQAQMSGTFNLLDKDISLKGMLQTTGKLQDTTSGIKAGLLKIIVPFLKKHSVTVVPFKITGTAQHSTFALDLGRKQRL